MKMSCIIDAIKNGNIEVLKKSYFDQSDDSCFMKNVYTHMTPASYEVIKELVPGFEHRVMTRYIFLTDNCMAHDFKVPIHIMLTSSNQMILDGGSNDVKNRINLVMWYTGLDPIKALLRNNVPKEMLLELTTDQARIDYINAW